MAIDISSTKARTTVRISGAMTIAEALETHQQLVKTLAGAQNLVVDLSDVIEIDTSGMQLLLALKKQGVPVAFDAISDAVRTLLDDLNLTPALGLEH